MSSSPTPPQAPLPEAPLASTPTVASPDAAAPSPSSDDAKAARRARMLANLEKGRKTALENRQKRALLKRLDKEEKQKKLDSDIKAKIQGTLASPKSSQFEEEIKQLRNEIKTLKASDRSDGLKDKQIQALKDEIAATKALQKQEKPQPAPVIGKQPAQQKPSKPTPPTQVPEPRDVVYSTFRSAPW